MKNTSVNLAMTALHERSLSPQTWGRSSGEWQKVGEPQLITLLEDILAFASRLQKASPLIFHKARSARGATLKKELMLMDDFQSLANGPHQLITLNFPNHNFHPAIDVVMKTFTVYLEDSTDAEEDDLSGLKARLKQLRSTLKRQSFLDRVTRHMHRISMRKHMFLRHFNQLLWAYGHARLHRFELSYARGQHRGFTPGKAMYEIVRGDWHALRSCLPMIYGAHMFGFAWQMDYTSEQGYRYFVAMLLSHDLQGAIPEASTLQQRWKDITGGTGEYNDGRSHHLRNCSYRSSASHPWQSKEEVANQIDEAALFMSQPDIVVGFAPKGPRKPFGLD